MQIKRLERRDAVIDLLRFAALTFLPPQRAVLRQDVGGIAVSNILKGPDGTGDRLAIPRVAVLTPKLAGGGQDVDHAAVYRLDPRILLVDQTAAAGIACFAPQLAVAA